MAKMTLEQVRDRLRRWGARISDGLFSHEAKEMAYSIDAAIKQREQDAKDAERYRWMRGMRNRERAADLAKHKMNLDAAIDAEMAKESGR